MLSLVQALKTSGNGIFLNTCVVITLTLFSISATVPMAQALIVDNANITTVLSEGTIVCANTSLSTPGTFNVIPQAPVDLVCGNATLQSTQTSLTGVYVFAFNIPNTLIFDPNTCELHVTILANTCTFPSPEDSS
ncbi:unnamed protein product [Ilex paraguariensis]|uniref:Uncharacterized protein n=1 Tax=Ilex paraguariensis TaxID=185542 RepID=A0ABC8RPQ3_9AQUA